MVEILSDVEQIKEEIKRIERETKNFCEQKEDLDKLKPSFFMSRQKKKQSLKPGEPGGEYFRMVDDFLDKINQRDLINKIELGEIPCGLKEANQENIGLEYLLSNHLVLEYLKDDNQKLKRELDFLNNENLILEKTNSSIVDTIKQQENMIKKLEDERTSKKECCEILMNEENIALFLEHERQLKEKYTQKQTELELLKKKLDTKQKEIDSKEKELQRINNIYQKTIEQQEKEERQLKNRQNLQIKAFQKKDDPQEMQKNLEHLRQRVINIGHIISNDNHVFLQLKVLLEHSEISQKLLYQ